MSAARDTGKSAPPAIDVRETFLGRVREALGPALIGYHSTGDGFLCLRVQNSGYRKAAEVIRGEGVDRLDFLSCVDWLAHLTLTLQGYCMETRLQVRLSTRVARTGQTVPTVTDLWFLADWEERETYDQFGLVFDGHPDLRRLLNPDSWEGHPLLKDYEDRMGISRPQYF